MFSEGDFKDKSCGKDVLSLGASKEKSKCPFRVDEKDTFVENDCFT